MYTTLRGGQGVRMHLWIKEKRTQSVELETFSCSRDSYINLLMYTFGDIYGLQVYTFSITPNFEYG